MEKNFTRLDKLFKEIFNEEPTDHFSCGGRIEIIGNHTDHNHGLCLVGNCSLAIDASAKVNNTSKVSIYSEGMGLIEVDLSELSIVEKEKGTSQGIIRGVANAIAQKNGLVSGFNAYMSSNIPAGAGVSSSAAFEVLIGQIFNYFFNGSHFGELFLAQAGQYAENKYFGKPCGLLDQIGVAFGKANFLDFADIKQPAIIGLPFNLPLSLFLITPPGTHADLVDAYAKIPNSMFHVAHYFNQEFLRDINPRYFLEADMLHDIQLPEDEIAIARHFFTENERVLKAKTALLENDVDLFLEQIRASQHSSHHNLHNTFLEGEYHGSPQEAIDVLSPLINHNGAIRIHGGGFKGSILAFIKPEIKEAFIDGVKASFPNYPIEEIFISPEGGRHIASPLK
ncbi:MAG TPA: galactokinase family protein [Bacilli bacterium]|nr:galactokinase family protein [Bacilli bacterium]